MLSRALSLATVTLLAGCLAAAPARAQAQNLEAGKSPSQIFAGACTACHKSPRGLLKTVPAGSLPGFLRQHYTTSGDMASLLSSFLVSNGAADTRYTGNPAKDAKSEARPGGAPEQLDRFGRRMRPAPPQEASRPQTEPQPQAARPDAGSPQAEPEPSRHGRNARRLARPGEAPDAAKPAEGSAPAQAATEGAPEGRKTLAKQRLGKRGRPGGEEPPKIDAAKTDATREEPAKGEAVKDDETAKVEGGKLPGEGKSEPGKSEPGKSEPGRSEPGRSEPGKSESAKIEAPKGVGGGEAPALRADPVPPVTPAPSASPAVSAAVSSGTADPAPAESAPPAPPPAVTTALAPPPPPPPPAAVAPAGPPAPPISQ